MAQINLPYNNWEDGDIAYAAQVLANFNAIIGSVNAGLDTSNLADGAVTDPKIGNRTIVDTTTPVDTANMNILLNSLANRIKTITGEANWKTAPVKSLKTMNTSVVTAVADSAAAVSTANTANTTANAAVVTANAADGKADTAVSTANTALGQDVDEPYTGALGAMKIAADVQTDYETQKPLIEQAVEDAEAAVASVAGKADVAYVNSVANSFTLGAIPDNSLTNAKLGTDIKVGSLATLTTTQKTNLVGAINEINEIVPSIANNLTTTVTGKALDATQGKIINDGLVAHKADDVSQGELHGFRLTDGKLEYFDGLEWQRVRGDGYPVGNISNFSVKSDDMQITLTWQDPDNVTITDSNDNVITIAKWKGTKILRKTGSYPANENDGVLIVDNGIKNQYSENGFIDTGLQNDVEYFYMAFPYTEEDVYTVDESNRISSIPTEIKIYGVEIDESNSNPETAVVYTDDAVGFIPASGNNGAFDWGSWEDIVKNEFMIKPCVLSNPTKEVNYYLDYNNRTKKEDGTNSILTGADGDVMTEFGQDIYWKWDTVGDIQKIQMSIKHFEGAVKEAFEVEDGYNQLPYYPLLLTQILFPILFKSTNSQEALGRGYVDGNSGYANTGGTNTKGFMYGETTGKQQMSFLGMEDYWGNKYQWIDGLVTDGSYNLLIGNSGFNDSGSGYTNHASGVSADTVGYIDTVQGGNDKGFIIKGKAGSETTHYCDYGYLISSRVADFGGYHSAGSSAGFADLRLVYSGSHASAVIGSRLFCQNNGKLYIGAYLGTAQNGKLRSVSGTTPSDTKTISAFRNEARANNV